MNVVEALRERLESTPNGGVVMVLRVFPKGQESGRLHEQGEAISAATRAIADAIPESSLFRLLWSQVAVLVEHSNLDLVVQVFEDVLALVNSETIETVGIVAPFVRVNSIRIVDRCLDETASRNRLGTETIEDARRYRGPRRMWSAEGGPDRR